ncbi:enoyl-CoA hydratase-related protein [Amycolatopsis saalfeldensis]|uniref:Enoyl-CoA hydratase/carnithine racemase n=1 Tax=Amycolatopsis saalfeldensis TaxID=394193 RepID=A0A1H8YFG3_9PSEU|nr:enoyl-CoA hydratase-related protein [Amycolatopsis saalfeldensis]SEP50856.1 Enoyl-CoA hydratase/carnithine racemase [Amycolatopsis saalfeldensis]
MIDLDHAHGVAVIRMHENRCGALDPSTLDRVVAALRYVGDSYAVVLTGWEDVFSRGWAGGDANLLERAVLAVARHPTPVVAAIGGDTLGAGYALAAAADARVMSEGQLGLAAATALTPEVEAILRRHAGPVWRAVSVGERTFGPESARIAGLVDACCAPGEAVRVAVRRAALLAGPAREPLVSVHDG